jgi:Transglycosylase SLT domain
VGRTLKAQAALGGVILVVTIAAVAGASSAGACQASGAGPVGGAPAQLIPLYQAAAAKYGLGPQGPAVLAAINEVETNFGQNLSTSSAGAVGWMQFEPGTWARYGVTPSGTPAPDGPQGWNNPADAIFSAANYLRASGAPADWQRAVFIYNHAQWYVSQVLSLAQTDYTTGLGKGGATSAASFASVCAMVATASYVNPLAHSQNLRPERIDMGVDYSGQGTIVAIGAGQITSINNAGWPNGTFIEEKLTSGQYAGKDWYYAEDITPTVQVGQTVAAGAPLGQMFQGGIETGWSVGDGGTTLAASLGQIPSSGDAGGWSTAAGASASRFLESLGAPPGVMQPGGPHGTMPAGYP